MTDIQTWLDSNYSEEDRSQLLDLYLDGKELEGFLDLTGGDFPKLERVWHTDKLRIINNYDLTISRLTKTETPKGVFLKINGNVEVKKYTPIEEVMEELYPEDIRAGITELDLTQKGLRGTLDLRDFTNLTKLTVNLDCPWGRKYANSNYITGFNFDDLNNLTELTLINNPEEWEVDRLAVFTNLEKLVIKGFSDEYPAQWTGSLAELEGLENLTELDISYNPGINSGLEKLNKLEQFKGTGTEYEEELKDFGNDIEAWTIINFPEEISADEAEVSARINEMLKEAHQSLELLNKKGLTDTDLENKVKILTERQLTNA